MAQLRKRRRSVLLAVALALALALLPHPHAEPGLTTGSHEVDEHQAEIEEAENTCISLMLLGCMGFMMATFYLVNWPDSDIRQISWEVISSTTSVFGALLLFQGCNRVVEFYFLSGFSPWQQVLVNMLHMLLWFAVLQLVLAYYAGALGEHQIPLERRKSLSRVATEALSPHMRVAHLESAEQNLHDIKLNTHAWGILLGHVTGFAAVNAWSSLQQVVPSFLSFLVPIVAFASISGIYKATARWRYEKTMADGEEDEFEVIWGEHVAETEDEVISLSVSFLTVQLLRFCITGQLPEASGEDSENSPPHSLWSCTLLLLVGVILGLAEMGRLLLARRAGTGAFARAVSVESSAEGAERGATWYQKISAMSFAWCLHISVDWSIAAHLQLDDSMKAVVSALLGTCLAFLLIFGLDKVADNADDIEVDGAIRTVISALGMLVGISWERCFDAAVGGVTTSAMRTPGRHLPVPVMNLLLAVVLALMVLPAWKWYILPKLHEEDSDGVQVETKETKEPTPWGDETRLFGRLGKTRAAESEEKDGGFLRRTEEDLWSEATEAVPPLQKSPSPRSQGPTVTRAEHRSVETDMDFHLIDELDSAPVDTPNRVCSTPLFCSTTPKIISI
ncbi:unnamed protein product [Durusdinium trenchii]|uniref:Uncharacterized protein n=3 Tax=Durusdinium trenchii TaxID=1381693 RepID=A0ABP0P5X1_9DINO